MATTQPSGNSHARIETSGACSAGQRKPKSLVELLEIARCCNNSLIEGEIVSGVGIWKRTRTSGQIEKLQLTISQRLRSIAAGMLHRI